MSGYLPSRPYMWVAFCALVLLSCLVAHAHAGESPVVKAPQIQSSSSPSTATFPLAADRYGWFWTFLENTLHSRGRMVQFGVIGMCIALYFMLRSRG